MLSNKLQKELQKELHHERYDMTDAGVYFPRQGVLAKGCYYDRINGGQWQATPNLIVNEGLVFMLNTAFGTRPKTPKFYIALFNGAASVEPTWTAQNFASVAGEIVSMSEGYTSATRPEWTPTDTDSNTIGNMNAPAKLNIATSSSITVTGAALLTASNKGGTTGSLISATRYPASRVLQNGDTFEVGYQLALTV